MGLSAVIAVASVGLHLQGQAAQERAEDQAKDAAREQKKARNEQRAMNAAQSASERRQQIREERVRRARVMQAASSTGTAGSSGEIGAFGSMGTQLSSNFGFGSGALMTARNISTYEQNAADFSLESQQSQSQAANFRSLGNIGLQFGLSRMPK